APLVVRAQPAGKMSAVGILGEMASDPSEARMWQTFRLGLRELGWIEGQNLRIESRWAEDNYSRLPELTADLIRLRVDLIVARAGAELESAFTAIARAEAQALFVLSFGPYSAKRQRLAELAIRHRLPTMFADRVHVEAGGLMSYGADLGDLFRRGAIYVDKILRGAKPGDLPVEQPTKFELVINLKTAKALGLNIPQSLL